MFRIRYNVRVVTADGKLITKKRFTAKDAALRFIADKLIHRRRASIARKRIFVLEVFKNSEWGISAHDPWSRASGPLGQAFIHTSVTKQLPISASIAEEKEQMRLLDRIAHSRGFNGISYSWVVFPSGRAYEGRGDLVIEAATEGFNTSSDSFCCAGNGDVFGLSKMQKTALIRLINRKQNQRVLATPVNIRGHREISTQGKTCPGVKITDNDIATIQRAVNA